MSKINLAGEVFSGILRLLAEKGVTCAPSQSWEMGKWRKQLAIRFSFDIASAVYLIE